MQQKNENDLFDELKHTSKQQLEDGIKKTDGLSQEQYDNAKRANTNFKESSWAKLVQFMHWIVGGIALVFFILFAALLFRFVCDVISSPEHTRLLLKDIWNAVLIAGATLFVQYAISKK